MKGVLKMAQTNFNIRIDEVIKKEAEQLFSGLGMNMTTAVNIFIRQSLRQRGIPFDITMKADPFYNDKNMKVLDKSIKAANEGKLTAHDLIEA